MYGIWLTLFTKMTRQNIMSTLDIIDNVSLIARQVLRSFVKGRGGDLNSLSIYVISVIVGVNNI